MGHGRAQSLNWLGITFLTLDLSAVHIRLTISELQWLDINICIATQWNNFTDKAILVPHVIMSYLLWSMCTPTQYPPPGLPEVAKTRGFNISHIKNHYLETELLIKSPYFSRPHWRIAIGAFRQTWLKPTEVEGGHVKCPTLEEGPLINPLVKAFHHRSYRLRIGGGRNFSLGGPSVNIAREIFDHTPWNEVRRFVHAHEGGIAIYS